MVKENKKLENLRSLDALLAGDVFGITFRVDYNGTPTYEEHSAVVSERINHNKLSLILDGSSNKEKHFYLMNYEVGQDSQASIEKGRLLLNANLMTLSVFYPSKSYEKQLKILKEAGFL